MKIALIGPGKIGIDYYKVLRALDVSDITVIGRGSKSAEAFFQATGKAPLLDEDSYSELIASRPDAAIVAVPVECLAETVTKLIQSGVSSILLEKPAGINIEEISQVSRMAEEFGTRIYVGYNRRFYASVNELRRLITEDGGVLSFHFDFTEWPHTIVPYFKHPGVLSNWLLANSSHVIDLAFYIGGEPQKWTQAVAGSLAWHDRAAIFVGSGATRTGALFTYNANWMSPGRWGLEVSTANRKYFLRPLEKLQAQRHGSVQIEAIELNESLDLSFKPGLFLQTKAFLSKTHHESMIDIHQHYHRVREIYSRIVEPT
jgi:predicted dehydrogenase